MLLKRLLLTAVALAAGTTMALAQPKKASLSPALANILP
ncbi:hypothetical protein ABIE28_003051 [Devosia sp. 2618]